MQKISRLVYFFTALLFVFLPGLVLAAVQFPNPDTTGFLINWGSNNTFSGLLQNIIKLGLSVAGLIAVLFVIIGGFQYMTSAGNEEMAETGKKTLTNAIIGLVIIILSYIIVSVINNALG